MIKISTILILSILLNFSGVLQLAAESAPTIAVLIKGTANPYWKVMEEGVLEKAKELNQQVDVQGVVSDSDAEGQLNICQTMLLKKPKAIIFAAVNTVNLAPCLKTAASQGIILVDLDGGYSQEQAQTMGLKILFSVGSDNYELGKKAASYLQGSEGKALVIEGYSGNHQGLLRIQGFKNNLPEGMSIVASLPGDWDRLKAADLASSTVSQHPDLAVVFAANDLMALGAVEALRSRGLDQVKVIGIDGVEEAIASIKKQRLTATIAQLPYLMGSQAVEKTVKAIAGTETFAYDQRVPVVLIDQQIITQQAEELLRFVK